MELGELTAHVPNFDALTPREKILLFAWHLHAHRKVDVITNDAMRDCFREANAALPDVTVYLPRMANRKPRELYRVRGGSKLDGALQRQLDAKYGTHPTTIMVSQLLSDLPRKISNYDEKALLKEALDCYRVKAYRAAIVMAWNLAFDHLLGWIILDAERLAAFNAAIVQKYPKKSQLTIAHRDDFEELREAETIEICRTAKLMSKNLIDILREKLKRRNWAAHPSGVAIKQSQADDAITDLINNVVLGLK
jgi:hypothetical protein